MEYYTKSWLMVAFVGGALLTLAFKDLYPDLEHRFRQRKRTKSRGAHFLESAENEEDTASSLAGNAQLPMIREGIEGCIGNTPLIRIKSLSDATGCEILAKAEVDILHRLCEG